MPDQKLQVIPLGGLGEFGMNCMALRYGDDIIVIDAGMMFPDAELLGVDIVTPDFTYLMENRAACPRPRPDPRPRRPHRRHPVPAFADLNIPVYGTPFTLALVERRLEEHDLLDDAKLNRVKPGDKDRDRPVLDRVHPRHALHRQPASRWPSPLRSASSSTPATSRSTPRPPTTSCSTCTPSPSTASAACCCCCRIPPTSTVPATPTASAPCGRARGDLQPRRAPHRHLLLLLLHPPPAADPRPGRRNGPQGGLSRPQHALGDRDRPQSWACFAFPTTFCCARRTSCPRPRTRWSASSPARRASRCRPCPAWRSTTTRTCGWSAATRSSLSARIIPGNEKAIYRMINHMARRGAEVVYGTMNPPVHVSGHGSAEELKLMLNLVRPRYFVPIHGEYRQTVEARRAGPAPARTRPGRDLHPRNRRDAGDRQPRRAQGRQGHGRPRLHRFGHHRRGGGGHRHPRPPPPLRRRLRAPHHRHQQAHRQAGGSAGDRHPRLCLPRRRQRPAWPRPARWWPGRWRLPPPKSAPTGA